MKSSKYSECNEGSYKYAGLVPKVAAEEVVSCQSPRSCSPVVYSPVELFERVHASGLPNFQGCRLPVPNSKLSISVWRQKLVNYEDKVVCEFLEFGFPLDFNCESKLSYDDIRNHKGAREFPKFISTYLEKESKELRVVGPFAANPLSVPLKISPLNTVPKSIEERRVIVDLSWPLGASVNCGISKDMYLNESIDVHYASVEEVCRMVLAVGRGALIYKRDLRHAYRQFPVDPRDYRYLGYYWDNNYFFDTVLCMGQRNAGMGCGRSTKAVIYMHEQSGYTATSYCRNLTDRIMLINCSTFYFSYAFRRYVVYQKEKLVIHSSIT